MGNPKDSQGWFDVSYQNDTVWQSEKAQRACARISATSRQRQRLLQHSGPAFCVRPGGDQLKERLEGRHSTVVEAEGITDEALEALRVVYPDVRITEDGVEIDAEDVSVYAVGDCLRPFDIDIRATYKKRATLDDVFLDLTGKALKE